MVRVMMRFGVIGLAIISLLLALAMFVDPRVILLPAWLLSQPGKEFCQKDPVASYITGSYYPCKGSPLTPTNVNTRLEPSGYCPLESAVLYAQAGVFAELLQMGADPKLCSGYPDRFYEGLLGSTCQSNPSTAEGFFSLYSLAGIRYSNAQDLFFLSARGHCEPGIRLALSLGAAVNAEDGRGKTALHYVVGGSDNSLRLSSMLVSFGGDPRMRVSSGETALEQAKRLNGAGAWPRIEAALASPAGK